MNTDNTSDVGKVANIRNTAQIFYGLIHKYELQLKGASEKRSHRLNQVSSEKMNFGNTVLCVVCKFVDMP